MFLCQTKLTILNCVMKVNSEIGSQSHVSDNPVALGKKCGHPLKKGDKGW